MAGSAVSCGLVDFILVAVRFWAVNMVGLVASFIYKLGTLVMFTNRVVIFGKFGCF